ncbi:NUDIX hydrolase [Roseibium salinum]|uniref:NUDIX hydrolase n=1 Tax=Roseibium salinum TaxID=1604349 RepID=UPI0036109AF3
MPAANRTRLYLESDSHAGPFYEQRGFRRLTTRPSEMPGGEIPLMEKVLAPGVHEVASLDISLSPETWGFETAHEAAIGTHFEEARKCNPYLWNGRTLKLMGYRFENGVFKGTCSESTFAAHLAWRDWGAPDASAYNLFGSAILKSSDGALLYGVMSDHTATAGMIYPPGGNLDPTDLTPEGKVDMIGAIYRELEEETGLTKDELRADRLLVAFDGPRIAIAQVFDTGRNAAELRENIIRFSANSEEQELADVRIIRSREDLKDPAIVPFARAIADELLP